jgi:hypothetical protein
MHIVALRESEAADFFSYVLGSMDSAIQQVINLSNS